MPQACCAELSVGVRNGSVLDEIRCNSGFAITVVEGPRLGGIGHQCRRLQVRLGVSGGTARSGPPRRLSIVDPLTT